MTTYLDNGSDEEPQRLVCHGFTSQEWMQWYGIYPLPAKGTDLSSFKWLTPKQKELIELEWNDPKFPAW